MRKLILSSGNPHKVDELKKILGSMEIQILTKDEVGQADLEVIEDGDTLEANALKKARELSDLVEGIVLADDTGLFVDHLDGAPGVYSARFAGEECSYEANNVKLLELLKDVPYEKRSARFKTVIALIDEDKNEYIIEGVCEGRIIEERKGSHGFGYDPLFLPDGYEQTFAELGEEIKNKISHRSRAVNSMKDKLIELLEK